MNLPGVVTQHQLVREMRGGKVVRVQDLHRTGAHDQQHRCVRADVRDLKLLHGRLHHRHGSCAVCLEDLAAEEGMICYCCDIYLYVFIMQLSMLMMELLYSPMMFMKTMTV